MNLFLLLFYANSKYTQLATGNTNNNTRGTISDLPQHDQVCVRVLRINYYLLSDYQLHIFMRNTVAIIASSP